LEAHLRLGTLLHVGNLPTFGKFNVDFTKLISELTEDKNNGNFGET